MAAIAAAPATSSAHRAVAPAPATSSLRAMVIAVLALLAVLLSSQPAAAASWTGSTRVAATDAYRTTILRTGASSAAVLWQRGASVYLRRTTDGGATWLTRQTLASGIGPGFAAAGSGASLDVAYTKRTTCSTTGEVVWRLYYRRSLDGGATWTTPKALIGACSSAADQDVARHANGQVTVAWTGYSSGRILVRTSTDGGATFRPAVAAARSTDMEPGASPFYRGNVSVAIGSKGSTYVAYTSAPDELSVRRSRDRGATWSGPTRLTRVAAGPDVELLAVGGRAVVAYTRSLDGVMQAVYRRTLDRGSTWSTVRQAIPLAAGEFSVAPRLAYRGGVLALVVKAGAPGSSPVRYRESTDFGATWSAATTASETLVEDSDAETGGVALLDGGVLAAWTENRGTDNEGIWVRIGSR